MRRPPTPPWRSTPAGRRRGARPAPVTLIVSALVLLALVAAIVMFYRSGVRQAGEAPQAIGTPVGALKSAPPVEAQPDDPAAGLQIYKTEPGENAEGELRFAPPPEAPAPRAPTVTVTPPPAPPPAPKAAPTTPVAAGPTASGLKPAPRGFATAPVKTVAPPPPKPAPAPQPAVAAPKPTPPAPTAASGGASVQIGAFSSQALADSNWAAAVKLPGGAGKGKHVELVAGKGLYRTMVTGFASRADATTFCNALKASGKACFVK